MARRLSRRSFVSALGAAGLLEQRLDPGDRARDVVERWRRRSFGNVSPSQTARPCAASWRWMMRTSRVMRVGPIANAIRNTRAGSEGAAADASATC